MEHTLMKTYRIYESDLEMLERELPHLMDQSDCNNTLTRKRWEAVKETVANVRWDYGPPTESHMVAED